MLQPKILKSVLICLPILAAAGSVDAAKLYRWVDDDGKVHYSDQVPPEHSKSARTRLNERGVEVEQVGAAKSPEEIAKEKELKRLRAEQQRLIEEQRAKDRVLLRTFRTEDDILMARNGKLTAIDVIIQIARSNIRRMKIKLGDMQSNAASLERQGKPISKNFLTDIESTRTQLKNAYASIIHKEQEKEQIRQKFADDVTRFRKLKNLKEEQTAPLAEPKSESLLDTVVYCPGDEMCEKAWVRAEKYVRDNATTRIQMLGDTIIMSGAPLKDSDISLTVSRIRSKGAPGAELFMDLQCKNSPLGDELCGSDQVRGIRTGFQPYLRAAMN
jgi:hypothetical protein